MWLRIAMLMALTELQTRIDTQNVDAAMAWIRHAAASAQFVLFRASEDAKLTQGVDLANRTLAFLRERG
jgi:hypothetical protein